VSKILQGTRRVFSQRDVGKGKGQNKKPQRLTLMFQHVKVYAYRYNSLLCGNIPHFPKHKEMMKVYFFPHVSEILR
jgi:hypothetical protein